MADPLSLTLGLLPLVGGAYTAFSRSKSKYRAFRKHSGAIERIHEVLIVEKHRFRNEVRLLLRAALRDDEDSDDFIDAILSNRHADGAAGRDLETEVQKCLSESYEPYRTVFVEIAKNLNALGQQLEELDAIKPTRLSELRARLKYVFNETKCDGLVTSLRDSNSDLAQLREQTERLQGTRQRHMGATTLAKGRRTEDKQLPAEFSVFGAVRRAAENLHQALAAAYSASGLRIQHQARLFLDAAMDEERDVSTQLSLLCRCHDLSIETRLLHFEVRSGVDWAAAGKASPGSNITAFTSQTSRRRKVHWDDDARPHKIHLPISPPPSVEAPASPAMSETILVQALGESTGLCMELHHGCSRRRKGKSLADSTIGCSQEGCIGFIRGLDQFRHSFFPTEGPHSGMHNMPSQAADFVALETILMGYNPNFHVTKLDQLRLARSVVSAVLKFGRTPWLSESWGMADLSVVRRARDVPQTLRTLHLGIEIDPAAASPDHRKELLDGIGESIEAADEAGGKDAPLMDGASAGLSQVTYAMLEYGVKNLSLFNLGTVLLQIDRWGQNFRVDQGDLALVRRLAFGPAELGAGFRDIILKCIYCDFGCGSVSSLARPKLQEAVYFEVVSELTGMISRLELGD